MKIDRDWCMKHLKSWMTMETEYWKLMKSSLSLIQADTLMYKMEPKLKKNAEVNS